MSLTLRRASLIDDHQEIVDLLVRNVTCPPCAGPGVDPNQQELFDWRHVLNPAGEAWVWLLCDQKKPAIATVSVFPRRMLVDGKMTTCGHVGVVAVDASYRSLGPAVQLQRTTFGLVDSGALAFCYDCPPDDQRMTTFHRLGMPPNSEIGRYGFLFRSNEFLEEHLGSGILSELLAAPANWFLGSRKAARNEPGLHIEEFTERFGDEFTELNRRVPSRGVIRGSRSADLLNWRYRECPAWDTPDAKVLVARRAGEPCGFLAFWIERNRRRAYISDLFGLQLNTVGAALLDAAMEVCQREKMFSLHGYCSTGSELKPLFARLGFRWRERAARVVAYESRCVTRSLLNHGLNWTFTQTDQM